jgi:hypothetical protein
MICRKALSKIRMTREYDRPVILRSKSARERRYQFLDVGHLGLGDVQVIYNHDECAAPR